MWHCKVTLTLKTFRAKLASINIINIITNMNNSLNILLSNVKRPEFNMPTSMA